MTYEATVGHDGCVTESKGGFGSSREALEWIASIVTGHNAYGALPIKLTASVRETCSHGRQAEYVKAADAYIKAVDRMTATDLNGEELWHTAYQGVCGMRDKLQTCQKCGEAVQ